MQFMHCMKNEKLHAKGKSQQQEKAINTEKKNKYKKRREPLGNKFKTAENNLAMLGYLFCNFQ